MERVNVEASKVQLVLTVILGGAMSLLALGLAVDALVRARAVLVPLAIASVLIVLSGALTWVVLRAHQRSVRSLSDEGLVRNDGARFAWTNLERVVHRIKQDELGKQLWRTEILFEGDESAWIIPSKVKNYAEISDIVRALPCEHVEEPV